MPCPSKTRFVAVCFLATSFGSFGAARADTIPEIVAKTRQAVVEIVTYDQQNRPLKTGTGFFFSPDGALSKKKSNGLSLNWSVKWSMRN
jgi:hypothetical protein